MVTKKQIIDTIETVLADKEKKGKIQRIKKWQSEFIFTTDKLESAFPSDKVNISKDYKTGHNVFYDITIETNNGGTPVDIVFMAKLTDLSHSNKAMRNEMFKAGNVNPSDKKARINLIDILRVTEDDDFLDVLETALKYYLSVAIPNYESKL